eukprot:13304326-Alexandrium_andersonii.AAC.1
MEPECGSGSRGYDFFIARSGRAGVNRIAGAAWQVSPRLGPRAPGAPRSRGLSRSQLPAAM